MTNPLSVRVASVALALLSAMGCGADSTESGNSQNAPDDAAVVATGTDGATPSVDGAAPDVMGSSDAHPRTDAAPDASSADGSGDAGSVVDAAGRTNCAPHPSACGYPDETNTGVPASVTLTPSGYINVTQDGTVLSGLDIKDGVQIQASNVTLRNCRVTGGAESDFLIVIRPGSVNTLIEDSTIAGLDNGTNGVGMGIFDLSGQGTTLRRLNMYYCAECINGQPPTIEDSYIHDLAVWTGSQGVTHDEDVYFPCGGNQPTTIQHNTLFNEVDQTATIYADSYGSACTNMVIDNNLLAGGGWTMYVPTTGSNFSFTNNRFSRLYYPDSGGYGPMAWCPTNGCASSAVVTGNIWDETGAPVQ